MLGHMPTWMSGTSINHLIAHSRSAFRDGSRGLASSFCATETRRARSSGVEGFCASESAVEKPIRDTANNTGKSSDLIFPPCRVRRWRAVYQIHELKLLQSRSGLLPAPPSLGSEEE